MSDPVSALPGARYTGYVTVAEAGVQGMITLRGDPSADALRRALRAAIGADMPDRRRIVAGTTGAVAWMSPDEVLILLPHGEAARVVAQMQAALAGEHALVVDVSDARAMFTLRGKGSGADVREVLAKLCPVDLAPAALPAGEVRRTRAAQAAVAFWIDAAGVAHLICFRSVAQYVFDLISLSARPGAEAGLFPDP